MPESAHGLRQMWEAMLFFSALLSAFRLESVRNGEMFWWTCVLSINLKLRNILLYQCNFHREILANQRFFIIASYLSLTIKKQYFRVSVLLGNIFRR